MSCLQKIIKYASLRSPIVLTRAVCANRWIPARASYRQLGRNDGKLLLRISETPG